MFKSDRTVIYQHGDVLKKTFHYALPFPVPEAEPEIRVGKIHLTRGGQLTIERGFVWDGASGPTIDTPSCKRASLVHDVGYILMDLLILPDTYKPKFDTLFRAMLKEDGMPWWRRRPWYRAVVFGGGRDFDGVDNHVETKEAP